MDRAILIPHRKPDNTFRFSPEFIEAAFLKIWGDGYGGIVFHALQIRGAIEWRNYVENPGVCLYLICKQSDKQVIGLVWLDHFQNKTAQLNYSGFRNVGFRNPVAIGKMAIQEILHKRDSQGEYVLDCLIGYAPQFNTIGLKCAERCGGKLAGTIPLGAWIEIEKKSAPMNIYYFEREENESL